jgi:hypothetical protein
MTLSIQNYPFRVLSSAQELKSFLTQVTWGLLAFGGVGSLAAVFHSEAHGSPSPTRFISIAEL